MPELVAQTATELERQPGSADLSRAVKPECEERRMPALDVNATQWRRGSRSIDVVYGVKAAVARRTVVVRDSQDLAAGSWSSSPGVGRSSPGRAAAS